MLINQIDDVCTIIKAYEVKVGVDRGGLSQHPAIIEEFLHAFGRARYLFRNTQDKESLSQHIVFCAFLTGLQSPSRPRIRLSLKYDFLADQQNIQVFTCNDSILIANMESYLYGLVGFEDQGLTGKQRRDLGFRHSKDTHICLWPLTGINIRQPPDFGFPVVQVIYGRSGAPYYSI